MALTKGFRRPAFSLGGSISDRFALRSFSGADDGDQLAGGDSVQRFHSILRPLACLSVARNYCGKDDLQGFAAGS